MAKKSKSEEKDADLPAPDDLRCQRNDGKGWRCRKFKFENHVFCQYHFEYAISQSQKNKTGRKSKPKQKSKSKPPKPQSELESEPDAKLRVSESKRAPGRSGAKTSDAPIHSDAARGSDGRRRHPSREKFLKSFLEFLDTDEESRGDGSNAKKRNVSECRDLACEFV